MVRVASISDTITCLMTTIIVIIIYTSTRLSRSPRYTMTDSINIQTHRQTPSPTPHIYYLLLLLPYTTSHHLLLASTTTTTSTTQAHYAPIILYHTSSSSCTTYPLTYLPTVLNVGLCLIHGRSSHTITIITIMHHLPRPTYLLC